MKDWSELQIYGTLFLANIAIAGLFSLFVPIWVYHGGVARTTWFGGLFCFACFFFNFCLFCKVKDQKSAKVFIPGFHLLGLSWVIWVGVFFLAILPGGGYNF